MGLLGVWGFWGALGGLGGLGVGLREQLGDGLQSHVRLLREELEEVRRGGAEGGDGLQEHHDGPFGILLLGLRGLEGFGFWVLGLGFRV